MQRRPERVGSGVPSAIRRCGFLAGAACALDQIAAIDGLLRSLCDRVGVRGLVRSFSVDAPGADMLIGEERRVFHAIRAPGRRAAFLAGRLAAKQLLSSPPFSLDWNEIEIGRDPLGAPRLRSGVPLHVSISHAGGVAVVVAAGRPVGVDLERNEARPDALARYFFGPAERRALSSVPPALRATATNRLWTRKEAAAKVTGQGGRLSFRDIDCSAPGIRVEGVDIALQSASSGDYVLSVALEKGDIDG